MATLLPPGPGAGEAVQERDRDSAPGLRAWRDEVDGLWTLAFGSPGLWACTFGLPGLRAWAWALPPTAFASATIPICLCLT